jgi:SpoVK/Ycf46/Vps4 family AAA+-type ATPase
MKSNSKDISLGGVSGGGGYYISSVLQKDIFASITLSKTNSILVTGDSQSGKSSALEATAHELQRLSIVSSFLLITPENLACDYPGDATRGLLYAFMKGKADANGLNEKNSLINNGSIVNDTNDTEIKKFLILFEDLDLIAPSKGGSNDVARVLMRELRNCATSNVLILAASADPSKIHSGVLNMFDKQVTLGILNMTDRRDALCYFVQQINRDSLKGKEEGEEDMMKAIISLADTACLGFVIGDVKFVVQEAFHQYNTLVREDIESSTEKEDDNLILNMKQFLQILENVISEHTPYQLLSGGSSKSYGVNDTVKGRRLHPSIVEIVDLRTKELIDMTNFVQDDNDGDGDNDDEEEDSNTFSDSSKSPLSLSIANSIRPRSERTTFDDICGQKEAKDAIIKSVFWPRDPKRSAALKSLGVTVPTGLMLYGPPGTGKTMLAKAVAGTIQGRFIEIKIPNILSSGVGDSERALKAAFDAAQNAAPAIIFMDEIQALFCRRDGGRNDDDRMSSLLTSQLLQSLDTLCRNAEREPDAGQVIVIAATNVPEALDPALLRPGRFDKLIYVGLPNEEDRFSFIHKNNRLLFPDLLENDMKGLSERLAKLTENFSGAEIENIYRVAALIAVTEYCERPQTLIEEPNVNKPKLTEGHLQTAIERMKK